jgi:type IV secretory pathway VirB10-like protein
MNTHEWNGNAGAQSEDASDTAQYSEVSPNSQLPMASASDLADVKTENETPASFVTRKDLENKPAMDKRKLLLLGGGLAAAALFFVFTAVLGRSPANSKRAPLQHTQQSSSQAKGSVTPLTETVRKPTAYDSNGQLSPSDIKRTRSNDGMGAPAPGSLATQRIVNPTPGSSSSLASVPSFSDTQQKWEEPKPYGSPGESSQTQNQQQNALKEPSLVFVRSQTGGVAGNATKEGSSQREQPVLQITPGTRIQAKLETQISSAVSAPVVAVVEYTYAIGDQIVIPAGARVYGQLRQADRSGFVDVKFDEIELLDGAREQIDAIGAALDLGPIKGTVFGKNTGKNFLIRTVSGLGSVAAMIVGNNTSSAFSEDDLLRERVAENVGTAGDSELMNLNANSRVVVSVPADTKIYIVFMKHEQTPSTLQRVAALSQ